MIKDCHQKVDDILFGVELDKVNNNVAQMVRENFEDSEISIKHNKNILVAGLKV